jgi:hypothetical protein
MKHQIAKVESGTIDLVHINNQLLLQFNCSCIDAIPFCQATCCKMQHLLVVELTDKEILRLGKRKGTENLIQIKTDSTECKFLNEKNLCSIQATKPEKCKSWHCSPGGVGEGITYRANGWMMLPSQH